MSWLSCSPTCELPSNVLASGTIHPSAILRIEEPDRREAELADFADDLRAMVALT